MTLESNTFKELFREARQEGDQAGMAAAKKDFKAYEARQKTRLKSSGAYTENSENLKLLPAERIRPISICRTKISDLSKMN